MKRKTIASSRYSGKDSPHMSIKDKLLLMDQLYQKAVEDCSLERYRREREKGVEEVRRRWQLLRERLLPNCPTGARR
jgi:hypothetical protein